MPQLLVDIALPVPIDHLFTYLVPPDLQPAARLGVRAVVPFGRSVLTGVIVGFPAEAPRQGLKSVREILDDAPIFSDGMLRLSRWVSDYYFSPLGEVLKAATPQGLFVRGTGERHTRVKPKVEKFVRLATGSGMTSTLPQKLSTKQDAIVRALNEHSDAVALAPMLKQLHLSLSTVKSMVQKGILSIELREVIRSEEYRVEQPKDITLNSHQRTALKTIISLIEANEYQTFLLHGITGSGKTQVYIDAIRKVLERGKTAIVLVPEISLTPQIVRRFKSHFGTEVALMHSQMSAGERYDTWRLAQRSTVKIVIGPRSAVFAPLANLGLIVVDEEHESSYKQFEGQPLYHARDVAIMRALQSNAVVVLGSATPSLESYHNALGGKYHLLEMPERVDRATLPRIELVDMADERRRRYDEVKRDVKEKGTAFPKRLPDSSISKLLQSEMKRRIEQDEGVIVLQNRRGFSHVAECFACGYVEMCDNCDVTLTYHATKKHLRCHYCGLVKKPSSLCPNCGGIEIRFHAFGTQQVHQELEQLFPEGKILRMDLDTTTRKGAHEKILRQFGEGGADILLGTQMVAKGLDFPRVTLVGVISADTQMLMPDFRSSERTFQLLTQVAGRSGRATLAGEVVIQTLQPQHYSLKHVVSHDFVGFYKEELEYRRELEYPPFSRIVRVEFRGAVEREVYHHAKEFAGLLSRQQIDAHSRLLGPADAAIPRVRGKFRKHLMIKNLKTKDPAGSLLHDALVKAKRLYDSSPFGKNKKVQVTIDVDPQGMM